MKSQKEILEKITTIIETYESGSWQSVENLRVLLRELSANHYYLTKFKIEYKNKHNEIEYKNKKSLGYGKLLAHEQCPELYKCRYILDSAKNVMQSIIMEISIIKNES